MQAVKGRECPTTTGDTFPTEQLFLPLTSPVLILKEAFMKYFQKTNLRNEAFVPLEARNLEFHRINICFYIPIQFFL